ncbi:MAG: MarR family winged helix-turn-helix transcriptional regulator [Anaerovoracaceae bacterium]|jgi:DNA-binding MarR family transcriptional regulator
MQNEKKCECSWGHYIDYRGMPHGDLDDLNILFEKIAKHYMHRICMIKSQRRVLTLLSYNDGMKLKDIQNLLVIDPTTSCGVMKMMEQKGWINRDKSDMDNITMSITDEGRKAADRLATGELEEEHPYSSLSAEEQETLKPILLKMLKSWNPNANWDN